MSTFSGLNTATTALWAAQRGMDVTGQNIANVNTDGYSRQRVSLQAVGGTAVPAIWSVASEVGSGVSSDEIVRIRDAFLEGRAQVESARTARLTVASDALAQVETALREPGTSGIQSMLADVWSGFSDLANNPTEPAARSQVLERLDILATGLRTTSATLDQQWTQTRDNLQALVTEVNSTARSIADLNGAIRSAGQAGLPVNELSDRRDALVMDLAKKVGGTTQPGKDGMLNVLVGGTTVVSGGDSFQLALAGVDSLGAVGTGNDPRVVTVPGGTALDLGGTGGGQVETLSGTLPKYRAALDGVAKQLVGSLNGVQTTGFDAAGNPGQALLGDGPGPAAVDLSKVTAASITLRITKPELLAAATKSPADLNGEVSGDGGNADAFFQLSLDSGGVDTTYRALVVALGVESAVAQRDLTVQSVISTQVDASRESVSGVNLDEEMTNMLSFQHAYSAAARMVTAIDEALDKLINGTGVVGR
ncbi:flagellar hook-associated protein FlgK [Geodermatophilus sp. SYSU D00965]